MKYVSTRGTGRPVSAAEAIRAGLCADGGLFMPESIPTLTREQLAHLATLPYPARAAEILSLYLTDFTYDELLEDAEAAYSASRFHAATPAPVHPLGDELHVLELFHGPTSAFKDMALQLMPRLFVRALRKCKETRTALILVATSGDTGKAALEGYRDVEGTKILVFYPTDGVSQMQKLQMQSQEGENLEVLGIRGNFDDAQSGVKRIFADAEIAERLAADQVFLSSANSINWGRLVPQIVYYVSAVCDLMTSGALADGQRVDICVPTGNFGNIFAALLAKRMGLPIGRLICASNSNHVLTDFFETGGYDRNRPFLRTMSPSMDILISSNLERLLYLTLGAERTAAYMRALASEGRYALRPEELALLREDLTAYYTDEADTRRTLHDVYRDYHYLTDPHTAVACCAALRYRAHTQTATPLLIVSTASPYKFAADVLSSLTDEGCEDGIAAIGRLASLTGVQPPAALAALIGAPVRHPHTVESAQMAAAVMDFIHR